MRRKDKDKKGITVTEHFQVILDESGRKSRKIWVDWGSEFYNRSMKSWLQDNDKEMYSTHNEEKSAVAEKLTNFTKLTSIWLQYKKKVYIDKLDGKVNKCNNAYHNTMKPINVKSITYINLNKENNKEDSRFNVDLHVRISKYKNIFAKGYTKNWPEEWFVM